MAVTGSTDVGRLALSTGSHHLKHMTLELGGKTPMIVCDDANVSLAVETAIKGMSLGAQGHSCSSTSRVLIHESLHDEFVEQLAERFAQIQVGDPFNDDTQMGPISHQAQYDKVLSYIQSGVEQGARLVCGGQPLSGGIFEQGLFLSPAVFSNVTPAMAIAQEEIYGPVISVLKWRELSEAIDIANAVDYGLCAVIMTENLNRAHRIAHAIKAGYVEINGPVSFALGSPFGGVKLSGSGREGNMEELLSYTQLKSINIQLGKLD